MINFQDLTFQKVIMHTISDKKSGEKCSNASLSNALIEVDELVGQTIKTRLIDAAGRDSRAFELEIENTSEDSFYEYGKILMDSSVDDIFIKASQDIAELLAESQRHPRTPGGYLIVIKAIDEHTKDNYTVVIKAEPHEALRLSQNSQITLLEKVFLSPSQKLYKIGVLCGKENGEYGALLFDDQFRQDGHPAEYFYRDFLGFSVSSNSKIQTFQFFNKTYKFLSKNAREADKIKLLADLKSFIENNETILRPRSFGDQFLNGGLKDQFISEISNEFKTSFVKDSVLIKNKLKQRKLTFPKKINIFGPENSFDEQVKLLKEDNVQDINSLLDEGYTVIAVKGKPFSDE